MKIYTGSTNPILHKKSEPVIHFDITLKQTVDEMISMMDKQGGIGLAAPQVGIHKNILVMHDDTKEKKTKKTRILTLINPVIKKHSEDLLVSEEGCLSLPGVFLDIERYADIFVVYYDIFGKKQKEKFSDMSSIIVQHEMDHLQGILLTDRQAKQKTLSSHMIL
jgi:peptide deformylase